MPPTKAQIFALSIDGGYNTEAGPSAGFRANEAGVVSVPWLTRANNVTFSLDGWPRKMPGASKVNSSATGATDHVMGIFDYWKSTTSGDLVQKRLIYSGTDILKDDADGIFDSLSLTLEADKMPWFEVFDDKCIMASTSTVDVPQTYDQSTIANLGGTPPNFSIFTEHKDRMWAAGVDALKSRLYYSVLSSAADWTGSGSGSIDISPDDGDVITGLVSHKDQLIIFKGPNKGSIWRITGSAPTGDDAFALRVFIRGVGCTSQQSIVRVRDDLLWWDDLGIHSLTATAAYGDYNEAFVSAPIATDFTKWLNHSRFRSVWGVNFAQGGYAAWTVSRSGSSTNNLIIVFDYRFNPPRFSYWPVASVASIGIVKDTSRETVPWFGTYTGFVLRGNRSDRNWMGNAISADTILPYLSFGDPFYDKQIVAARIGFQPKGISSFTIGYKRDAQTQQTVSIPQTGTAAILGSTASPFMLNTSILGAKRYINKFFEPTGQFKEIQFQLTEPTVNVDFEPHSLAVQVESAGVGLRDIVG